MAEITAKEMKLQTKIWSYNPSSEFPKIKMPFLEFIRYERGLFIIDIKKINVEINFHSFNNT